MVLFYSKDKNKGRILIPAFLFLVFYDLAVWRYLFLYVLL